jgi:hypothetical protein
MAINLSIISMYAFVAFSTEKTIARSLRPFPPWIFYLQSTYRRIVETTGSLIERLLPKSIHSVTPQGFELKVGLFVLATSLNFLG